MTTTSMQLMQQLIQFHRKGNLRIHLVRGPEELLHHLMEIGETNNKEEVMADVGRFSGSMLIPGIVPTLNPHHRIRFHVVFDVRFLMAFEPHQRKALILHQLGHVMQYLKEGNKAIERYFSTRIKAEKLAWENVREIMGDKLDEDLAQTAICVHEIKAHQVRCLPRLLRYLSVLVHIAMEYGEYWAASAPNNLQRRVRKSFINRSLMALLPYLNQ